MTNYMQNAAEERTYQTISSIEPIALDAAQIEVRITEPSMLCN